MALHLTGGCAEVAHIKVLGTECSDGIVLVDLAQSIIWANHAALRMHGVEEIDELGGTIDEYHTKFQVKYLSILDSAASAGQTHSADQRNSRQPEVLIEFRPAQQSVKTATHRTRKIILLDENGRPNCTVFFIRRDPGGREDEKLFSDLLPIFPVPAAILSQADRRLVAANPAYVAACARCEADGVACVTTFEMPVEVAGEACVLVSLAGPAAACATPAPAPQAAPRVDVAAFCLSSLHSVPTAMLDDEFRLTEVNQPWLDWLDFKRDVVVGHSITDFMPPRSADHFLREARAQREQSGRLRDIDADFVSRQGRIVHGLISASPIPGGAGQDDGLITFCIDVTDNRRADDSFAAVFAGVPVPMLLRKLEDSRIIQANEAFVSLTGVDAAHIAGRFFEEMAAFPSKLQKEALEAGLQALAGTQTSDVTLKTAQGETLDCVMTATKVFAFGKSCVLLCLQDVTERRRTEGELLSAIDAVIKEGSWLSQSVVERLAAQRAPAKPSRKLAALDDLTPRERDVLRLISLGLPDAEIAERLGLKRSTVRNHLSTLYSKINVRNRGSAIIWARERCINLPQIQGGMKIVRPKFGAHAASGASIILAGGTTQPKANAASAK